MLFQLALLLISINCAVTHVSSSHLVCKNKITHTCISWRMPVTEGPLISQRLLRTLQNNDHVCGISNPPIYRGATVSYYTIHTTPNTPKKIICKLSDLKPIPYHPENNGWLRGSRNPRSISSDTNNFWRTNPQSDRNPRRARYRGQTQSQYLNIGTSEQQAREPGKAEAESFYEGSRAIVSGNSGMGQAQSQSNVSPECEPCYGPGSITAKDQTQIYNIENGKPLTSTGGVWPGSNTNYLPGAYPGNLQIPGLHRPQGSGSPELSETQGTQTGGQHPGAPGFPSNVPYQPQGPGMYGTGGTQGPQTEGQTPGAPGFQPITSYRPQGPVTPGISKTQQTQTGGQYPVAPGQQPAGLNQPQSPGTSGTQGSQIASQHPGSTGFPSNPPYLPQDPGTYRSSGIQGPQAEGQTPSTQSFQPIASYQPQGPRTPGIGETPRSQTESQNPVIPGHQHAGPYQPQGPGTSGTQGTQIASQHPGATGFSPTVPYQPQGPGTSGMVEPHWTQTGGQHPFITGHQPEGPYQPQGPGTGGSQGTPIARQHPGATGFLSTTLYQPQGVPGPGIVEPHWTQTGGQHPTVPAYQPAQPYQPQVPEASRIPGTQIGNQFSGAPGFSPTVPYQPGTQETSGTRETLTGGQTSGAPGSQPTASYQPQGPEIGDTQWTKSERQYPFVPGYQNAGPHQPYIPQTSGTQGTLTENQHPGALGFQPNVPLQPQSPGTYRTNGNEGIQTGGPTAGAPGSQPTVFYQPQGPGTPGGQHQVIPGYQLAGPYQPEGPETRETQIASHNLGAPGLSPIVPYQSQSPGIQGPIGTKETQTPGAPGYQPAGSYQPQGPVTSGTQGTQIVNQHPVATGFLPNGSYQPQGPGTSQIPGTRKESQNSGASGFSPTVPYQPQSPETQQTSGTQGTLTGGQQTPSGSGFQQTLSFQPQGTKIGETQRPQTGGQYPFVPGYQPAKPYQPQDSGTSGKQETQLVGQHQGAPGFLPTLPYQPQRPGMPGTSGSQWTRPGNQPLDAQWSQPTTSYQPQAPGPPETSVTHKTQPGGSNGSPEYQPTGSYRPQGPVTSVTQGTQIEGQYPGAPGFQQTAFYQPQPGRSGTQGSQEAQQSGGFPGFPGSSTISTEGIGQSTPQLPGNGGMQGVPGSYPYVSNLPAEATGPLTTQLGGNFLPPVPPAGGSTVPGLLQTDYTGVNTGAAGSNGQDDGDSQAEANVQQGLNETTASASSQGRHKTGKAQTQVSGVYSGSGSFSAQAQIVDENKGAQSQVNGNKQGATSSSQSNGGRGQSQAMVQLGSESGAILTESQSGGANYLTNTQVQGSYKGGMADSQANGPGSTSSQAQIGFTPYQSGEKEDDTPNSPFMGSGSASSQSGFLSGQSQTQIHGKFRYGISYNGAAQATSGGNKDTITKNRAPFNPINVFDTSTEYMQFSNRQKKMETPAASRAEDESRKSPESKNFGHTHSDHHDVVQSYQPQDTVKPNLELGNDRKPINGITKQEPVVEYDDDTTDTRGDDVFENYNTDETQQAFTSPSQSVNKKQLRVNQSNKGNTQHIILGSLDKQDAEIIQDDDFDENIDDGRMYEPGEVIPDTQGYAIPMGFRGHLSSVSSKDNTYARGGRHGHSQAQTVNLTPGSGRVTYTKPRNSYDTRSRYVQPNNLRSLTPRKPATRPESDSNYISVSKSVTGSLDGDNNLKPQYSHTYYTKSSSCGYFTFTCNIVNGSNGRTKVCKPKVPTNPDGTPIQC